MDTSEQEAEDFALDMFAKMLAQVPESEIERLVAEAREKSSPPPPPRPAPDRPPRKGGSGWTFFFGALTMVLFVAFTAAYEGARIGFLSEDASAIARIETGARKIEAHMLADGQGGETRKRLWRQRTLEGDPTACRGLGLLCLCGRGGIEIPTDDITLSRFWSLFGFAFYFGLGVFGYYVLRPIVLSFRASEHHVLGLVVPLVGIPVAVYLPGLIVFHYARLWYPVLSSWMAEQMAGLL